MRQHSLIESGDMGVRQWHHRLWAAPLETAVCLQWARAVAELCLVWLNIINSEKGVSSIQGSCAWRVGVLQWEEECFSAMAWVCGRGSSPQLSVSYIYLITSKSVLLKVWFISKKYRQPILLNKTKDSLCWNAIYHLKSIQLNFILLSIALVHFCQDHFSQNWIFLFHLW